MTIDKEFKELIPPLSSEEYQQLEENILRDGIRDSLVVWDNNGEWILIDGHNRYEIAQKHNLQFNQRRMEFPDRDAVKEWIILNQLGRRNIPNYVRAELALRLKPMIAERAKENQGSRTDISQKSVESHDTQKELAKAAGVSHDTIHKVEKIQKEAPEETKEALRRGELSINSVYSGIIAAEHENKLQQKTRELREAKHRAESYDASEKVVDFGEAKQHSEDNDLIFKEYADKIDKMHTDILHVVISGNNEVTLSALKAADRRELIRLQDVLSDCYRSILKAQRQVVEVIEDEK